MNTNEIGMDRVFETWALQNLLLRCGFKVSDTTITPARFKQGSVEERVVAVFLRTQDKECPLNVGPLVVSNEHFIDQYKRWVESTIPAKTATTAEREQKERELTLLYESCEVIRNRDLVFAHIRKAGIHFTTPA